MGRTIFWKKNKTYEPNFSSLFICIEENKPSDLIGKQKPLNENSLKEKGQIIEFEYGILIKSIKNGKVCILDNVDQLQPKVTERLNASLDKKYNKEEERIEVPENPNPDKNEEVGIKINKSYRLVCTADIERLNKLSPAFINRFDVILLEDQLKEINQNEEELKKLFEVLLENAKNQYLESKLKEKSENDTNNNQDSYSSSEENISNSLDKENSFNENENQKDDDSKGDEKEIIEEKKKDESENENNNEEYSSSDDEVIDIEKDDKEEKNEDKEEIELVILEKEKKMN